MKITFLGATGTVTGSKYLVEHGGVRVMVDCGLFQGLKELRLRNWEALPADPATVDAVLLTHAHIDHSGYLPLFVKHGFKGHIYSSSATRDLCGIMLPDSAHLQEEDAARANRYGYSKHTPALPLYTVDDAFAALEQFRRKEFGRFFPLGEGLEFAFHRAGHILGAAMVELRAEGRSLLFSGDLGRSNDPVIKAPVRIPQADFLVLESTYGNRLHSREDPALELARLIKKTAARGGKILIPAFAVGRAQNILYHLYELKRKNAIPDLPIYLDSPLAINATRIFHKHVAEHRLTNHLCDAVCALPVCTRTAEDSKLIGATNGPAIIISASGMATGGRVLHHLKSLLGDHRNTVIFTGFQAPETRGERLLAGEREIKIHGQMFPVRARIRELSNMSAHADWEEMLAWLGHFKAAPARTFLTHGNPEAAAALRERIEKCLGWPCEIPQYGQVVEI